MSENEERDGDVPVSGSAEPERREPRVERETAPTGSPVSAAPEQTDVRNTPDRPGGSAEAAPPQGYDSGNSGGGAAKNDVSFRHAAPEWNGFYKAVREAVLRMRSR